MTKKKPPREKSPRRRASLPVRILIGILIVLVVGGISFAIGYFIGTQLGAVAIMC